MDSPEEITRKVKKAVTDTDGEVRFDPATKPGLANLLSLLAAATESRPEDLAGGYERYGDLKADVAAALIESLRPLQERYAELRNDLATVSQILAQGADAAAEVAEGTYRRAADAVGLLPPAR